jgi:hypothetical protein
VEKEGYKLTFASHGFLKFKTLLFILKGIKINWGKIIFLKLSITTKSRISNTFLIETIRQILKVKQKISKERESRWNVSRTTCSATWCPVKWDFHLGREGQQDISSLTTKGSHSIWRETYKIPFWNYEEECGWCVLHFNLLVSYVISYM